MVIFVNNIEDARQAVEQGSTAVEAAFGNETVVNDPSEPFDHHNRFSNLPSASLQAYNSNKLVKSVVVNHIDLDCVMASALLLGIVSRSNPWIKKMIPLIEITDRHGLHSLSEDQKMKPEYQLVLFYWQKNFGTGSSTKFNEAMQILKTFEQGPNQETGEAIQKEGIRKDTAEKGIVKHEGNIVLVNSPVWGFDVWYKTAPIVVALDPIKNTISVAARDLATAEKYFGQGGFKNTFQGLGPGWGGRETVGGSPRGQKMTINDAIKAFDYLKNIVNGTIKQARKKTDCHKSERVFVYRTLKNRNTYKALGDFMSHQINKSENAILSGYKDVNRGTGYHTIIKSPGSKVKGKILLVNRKDLIILDQWEAKYKRIKVKLDCGHTAWTYQLKVHKIVEGFIKKFK